MQNEQWLVKILTYFENISAALVDQGNGRVLFVNRQMKAWLPKSAAENGSCDFFDGWDKNSLREYMKSSQNGEIAVLHSPSGEILDFSAKKVFWQNKVPVYLVSVTPHRRTKQENQQLKLEQETLYNRIPAGIADVAINEEFTVIEANSAFYQILGRTKQELRKGLRPFLYREDLNLIREQMKENKQDGECFKLDHRMVKPNGALFWVHVAGRKSTADNGTPFYSIIMLEVTKQKETQFELEQVQRQYQMAFQCHADLSLEYNPKTDQFSSLAEDHDREIDSIVLYDYDLFQDALLLSGSYTQQLQMPQKIARAMAVVKNSRRITYESQNVIQKVAQKCRSMPCSVRSELKLKTKSGAYEWFELYACSIWDEKQKKCTNIVGKLININRMKQEVNQWREQAKRDSLTGLYNRKAFEEILTEIIRKKEPGALIFLDVDHFKQINDTMGHTFGDQILTIMAKRISSAVRQTDVVARFGGDEFVVYLRNIAPGISLESKLKQFCGVFRQNYREGENKISLSGSCGVALFPRDGESYSTLLKKADQALYWAKNNGKDCYAYYEEKRFYQSQYKKQKSPPGIHDIKEA